MIQVGEFEGRNKFLWSREGLWELCRNNMEIMIEYGILELFMNNAEIMCVCI